MSSNHELTAAQCIFVIENGYLAFVAGMMVCWRLFKSRTNGYLIRYR